MQFGEPGALRSRYDIRDYLSEGIFQEEHRNSNVSLFSGKSIPDKHFLFDEGSGAQLTIAENSVYNQGRSHKCFVYAGCVLAEWQAYHLRQLFKTFDERAK